jgi:GcrA cell cycle regulator
MSPVRYKVWTEEDAERLKALIQSGASAVRASAALKRPLTTVKLKARKMGMPFPHDRELKKKRQRMLKDK